MILRGQILPNYFFGLREKPCWKKTLLLFWGFKNQKKTICGDWRPTNDTQGANPSQLFLLRERKNLVQIKVKTNKNLSLQRLATQKPYKYFLQNLKKKLQTISSPLSP